MRVGTSGWQYRHWRERFYPKDLPLSRWLEHYAAYFDTVEVNSSFYRQPERATFAAWRAKTPEVFRFSVKVNRFISHLKRLNVGPESIARTYGTVSGLGPKLAVMLVQLPPKLKFDPERLDRYLRLASRRRRRHALEPRDASWLGDAALAHLRARRVALVIADSARWPTRVAVTADLVYVRFHGPEGLYRSRYTDAQLRRWAELVRGWRGQGLDVYAYFNNDANAYAVRNAFTLRDLIG